MRLDGKKSARRWSSTEKLKRASSGLDELEAVSVFRGASYTVVILEYSHAPKGTYVNA